jgi:hypothetical protein
MATSNRKLLNVVMGKINAKFLQLFFFAGSSQLTQCRPLLQQDVDGPVKPGDSIQYFIVWLRRRLIIEIVGTVTYVSLLPSSSTVLRWKVPSSWCRYFSFE